MGGGVAALLSLTGIVLPHFTGLRRNVHVRTALLRETRSDRSCRLKTVGFLLGCCPHRCGVLGVLPTGGFVTGNLSAAMAPYCTFVVVGKVGQGYLMAFTNFRIPLVCRESCEGTPAASTHFLLKSSR